MKTLTKLANGRNILLLLALFLVLNIVIIPAVYPTFQTLDTLTSYTPEKAYQLISSYGAPGRQSYATIELTLDLIYPLISALLFSLVILYTLRHAFPTHPWTHKLARLPFVVMLADYLENGCVLLMLFSYPRPLPLIASLSNIFTVTKFILSPFELIFVVALVAWLIQAVRHRLLQPASHRPL